jgi:hypothetical protein
VNLAIRLNGISNRRFNPAGPIDENLTARLQRYVVPGFGRKEKHFSFEYKQYGIVNNSQGA